MEEPIVFNVPKSSKEETNKLEKRSGHLRPSPAEFEPKPAQGVSKIASRWTFQGASGDMLCKLCQKRVYEMEKIIADKSVYHKSCFKCQHCMRVLNMNNFASMDGQVYCKPHFIEIFKTKGNYDEGFGKERHSKQWQNRETTSADDKVDDGLESIPSIKNLKSRFETSPTSDEYDAPVRRSRVDMRSPENGERAPALSRGSRPASKWDKPKGEPPAPINRKEDSENEEEEERENELPPPAYTKTMLARFQSIEEVQSPPKVTTTSVKKSSPAAVRQSRSSDTDREQVTNGHGRTEEVIRSGETTTEELPEQGFTKSLLAQWRTKEQEAGTGPAQPKARAVSKSPARNWSRKESPASRRVHTPESDLSSPDEHRDERDAHRDEQANSSNSNRDVVRETDRHDEDELPPPSFTRNMLAKFQSMQEEAQREASNLKPPAKKQFKWQVKEAKPLRGITPTRELDGRRGSQGEVNGRHTSQSDEDEYHNGINGTNGVDEMPQAAYTRDVVAKFRSMEDTSHPAPTPESNARLHKAAYSDPPRRFSNSPAAYEHHDYNQEYNQDYNQAYEDQMSPDQEYYDRRYEDYEDEPRSPVGGYTHMEVREEELPEQGMTKNLLAKFQSLQA